MSSIPDIAVFQQARMRIRPHITVTPVTRTDELNCSLKWESHQRTNSFKLRGALNKVLQLSPSQLRAGLVAASAGNHGQGVALAAQMVGAKTRIFAPSYAPQLKIQRMAQFGAKVELVPGHYGDAEQMAIQTAIQTGSTYISPYNDVTVIAGAGTLALEWLEQSPGLRRLVVPLGGGGLITGIGLVAHACDADIQILGVQSEASPYMQHQFYRSRMDDVVERPSLADGLAGSVEADSITITWLRQVCDGVILVSEDEIATAIAYAYKTWNEVIEGSAAVGLAAVLAGKVRTADRSTGILITGGNIDPLLHAAICARF